jgi:lipoate-protein ligase A
MWIASSPTARFVPPSHKAAVWQAAPLEMTAELFVTLDVYRDFAQRSAAMNMAIDEALLESAAAPSIRFYRWESPALSFGYFGKYADVAEYAAHYALVRRWTGGGVVFHGEDLTYAIVIPASEAAFGESSMSIYKKIHRALCDVLNATGKRAELSSAAAVCGRRKLSSQQIAAVKDRRYSNNCFANPVRSDVILDGRKVAGAAQRRTRSGLLQQGSIQGVDLGNGLAERFAQVLSANCKEREVNCETLARARGLAEQKYGAGAWLRKR